MVTPLKNLPARLSPRILSPLSPLSPRLLSVPSKHENSINVPNRYHCETERITYVAKKLIFSQHSSPNRLLEPVQVKITDYSIVGDGELTNRTRDVLINTPNKRNIIEKGIEKNKYSTVLGIGSFGKVVRGINKGTIVAVKVVKNALKLREKNALNLNHENIVRTLDIIQNQEGNFSLIIMDYFPNCIQLETLLENESYDMGEKVVDFALDICTGLGFIHENGILHLDIKPQNVLVANNVCKICDFGNSIHKNEADTFKNHGTIVYTAPELLQGINPTEKCDVYSLGILLWQLKSRCPPYRRFDNPQTVIYKVVKWNWRPEELIPVDGYSELYQSCWDADPSKRPLIKSVLSLLKKMV